MTSPRSRHGWDFQVQQFLLPKAGHTLAECEDAIGINLQTQRFAIADGATEAFDAKNWAQRLANNWVDNSACLSAAELWEWLNVEGQALEESWRVLQLSWYSEEKAQRGSFAAFVGVELNASAESLQWSAIALGDSCLLHFRSGTLVDGLPFWESESFTSIPVLAPSRTSLQSQAEARIVARSGELESGDELLLLSDAAAAWYLKLYEDADRETRARFADLLEEKSNDRLLRFFEHEREAKRIKDDDLSVVRIMI